MNLACCNIFVMYITLILLTRISIVHKGGIGLNLINGYIKSSILFTPEEDVNRFNVAEDILE